MIDEPVPTAGAPAELPALAVLWTAVACVDSHDTVVAANASFASVAGRPVSDLIGARLTDLATREQNADFYEGVAATRADGVQRRVRNHSGDLGRVFDNVISRAGDVVVIEVADVTEELREHDRRRQAETARDVIWERVVEYFVVVDLQDREIIASPAVWERWPIAQLEAAVRDGSVLEPPPDAPRWSDPWPTEQALFDGRVERTIAEVYATGEEQRHHTAIPLEGRSVRSFDTQLVPWIVDGVRRGVVIISHDTTDVLRQRHERTMAEEAAAQLLASLPASVWEVDIDAQTIRPLFADRRQPALPAWGAPSPLEGYLASWDPDSRIRLRSLLAELPPGGRTSARATSADLEREASMSITRVGDVDHAGRRRALVVVTDMTREFAEDRADERMSHATQVMRFAQGVAHDFGNVAQVVSGYAELLAKSHDDNLVDMASRHLESASNRAVSVARRIAMIAKVERVVNGPLDIGALVLELGPELSAHLGPGVSLTIDAEPGLWCIGERGQLASGLENLCGNASNAMAAQGAIVVRAHQMRRGGRPGIELTVADNGPGIPPELLASVFDPFVTGRPGVGTGLGLYLIQEYLYSLRGEVSVESSSAGATFRLWFPAAESTV